jgi:hypothetical protein
MKRIAIVAANPNDGLPYQRAHLPFRELRHKYEFRCYSADELRHSDAFYSDAVILIHPLYKDMLHVAERARYHYQVPVIVDIDDLVTETPEWHPGYVSLRHNCLQQIIMSASHVVYSTRYLQQRLAHLNRNSSIIENSISERVYKNYKPVTKPHANCFIAGWTGGQSHVRDLDVFTPGLRSFLLERHDAKAYFHVLKPASLNDLGTQVIFEPDVADFLDYPGVAAAYPFSCCMVGLINHPFNHAKSDLKLLEMAPHGIPLIASPRSDFIQHADKNIMLYAEDNSQEYPSWRQQLDWAADHPDEMQAMAERARDYVLGERLSIHAAAKWDAVLSSV